MSLSVEYDVSRARAVVADELALLPVRSGQPVAAPSQPPRAIASIRRAVVARFANAGIGDHLSCVIGAWWYARQTGRHLVVDWRGSRFNRDATAGRNCFHDFFQATDTLAGVPLLADDSVAQLPFSDAAYPRKWNRLNLLMTDHVAHTAEEIEDVNRLVRTGRERAEPWVIFNQWIDSPPREELRRVLQDLQFAAPIRAAADTWLKQAVGDRAAVAIHIRHGNGENIGERAAFWLDPWRWARQTVRNRCVDMHRSGSHGRFGDNMPDSLIQTDHFSGSELSFLKRVRERVRGMQKRLDGPSVPVLFCDSPTVVAAAGQLMPDLLVPPKAFRPPNAGPLHALGRGLPADDSHAVGDVAFEMCVEMELMRRCAALVCMPSGFSIFARELLERERVDMLSPVRVNRWLHRVLTAVPMPRAARAT